jgi:3D (Asp-Asp-Asp) domain-containing protein
VDGYGQPLQPEWWPWTPLHTDVLVTGYTDSHFPQGGFFGHDMDTGGAIQGNRSDIFMDTNPETVAIVALDLVTVYVLGN